MSNRERDRHIIGKFSDGKLCAVRYPDKRIILKCPDVLADTRSYKSDSQRIL